MRMTEPLPNCFSIWPSAASSALSRSVSAIPLSSVSVLRLLFGAICDRASTVASTSAAPLGAVVVTLRRGCDGPPVRRRAARWQHNEHVFVGRGPSQHREASPGRTVARSRPRRRADGTIGDRTACRVHAKLTSPGRGRERRRAGGAREKAGGRRAAGGLRCRPPAWRPAADARSLPRARRAPTTQRLGPLQGRLATTHSWSVHYASNSTESKQDPRRERRAGPASGSQTVTMGKGTSRHSPSSSSAASPTSKATSPASASLAGLSVPPGDRRRGPVDRVLDRQRDLRADRGRGALADVAKELALRAPLLPRARPHARRGDAVDAIDGTQTSRSRSPSTSSSTSGPTAPTSRSRRTRVNAKGQSDGRRAHHLFQVGGAGAPRGPQADRLRRARQRRLRAPADPVGARRRGKMLGIPAGQRQPWAEPRRSPRHRAGPPGE